MDHKCAEYFIKELKLKRHPTENGFMSDIHYQSKTIVQTVNGYGSIGDCVQFLYESKDFAPWHRMKTSDEIWIHQYGGPMNVYTVDEDQRKLARLKLEPCKALTINAGIWFAAEPADETKFCLYSVFLCPGFKIDDCEFAKHDFLNFIDDETDKIFISKFLQTKICS